MSNDNTIHLIIDVKNEPHKYPFALANRDSYSSDLSYKSHMNYHKSKNGGGTDTLLEDLASGALQSAFYAIKETFFKKNNVIVEKQVNNLMKEWVKSNPNMTWDD